MRTLLALALLLGGGMLLYFGITASNSLGSEVSKFFTGSPTNKAIWMLIAGTVCAGLGAVGLFTSGGKQLA